MTNVFLISVLSKTEEFIELKTEVETIKRHLSEEYVYLKTIEEISVALEHIDALLTGFEIDSQTSDLTLIANLLNQEFQNLQKLNETLNSREQNSANLLVKLNYLNALYADLLLRLQKLQKGCDHGVQVWKKLRSSFLLMHEAFNQNFYLIFALLRQM